MNKTKYLQTDGRWGGLPYPKVPCYIRNVGCGEVSIANLLIEMEQYAQYTPATIQPYCKQYGAPNCDGTYLSAICKMMTHYGLTDVKECETMPQLWTEMSKGNRVAVLLMGKRPGGSKKIHWTSGGHFISAVDFKVENGKHYLYIKDPGTDASNHNGWLTYEEYLKGDVVGVYVGATVQIKPQPTPTGKIAVDGIGGTNTIKATQKFLKVTQDGYLGDQIKKLNVYYPSITAVKYGNGKSGSQTVKALQRWLDGLTVDGVIGQGTTAVWQKKLRDLGYLASNEKIDGIFGVKSMKAWQRFLNDQMDKDGNEPSPIKPTDKPPYRVIDVSDWQGQIDWAKVKASGIVGAIIRYADGIDTLDRRFQENMKNAKANGLHIGSYIFSRAKTKAQAEEEAIRLFNACKQYGCDMPLYIDLEVASNAKYANTVAQAFIAKIKELGGRPGVYANLNWWNNYLKPTAQLSFAMWLAQYNKTMDYKPKSYVGMWQYSSSGSVNGIKGKVDMDECYVAYWEDAPKPDPTPTPPKKTIDELAYEVIEGKWGSGDERKKRLTEAGYDYDAVQKRVNEIVAKLDKIMTACQQQADWMRNAKYGWESNPTIEKSKKKGTCVTYVACVLQRLGIEPSGKYVWHDESGKVYGNNDKMEVIYPNGKTLHQLKNELRKGDIIMDGNKNDPGGGSHIFILTGKWDKNGNPTVWDNHSAQDKGGKSYVYTRNRPVIAIVRVK